MTSKPSHTNCPSSLPRALTSGFTAVSCLFVFGFSCSFSSCHPHRHCSCFTCSFAYRHISGGYSRGVPPLPIPNRAVKPARADGTAPQCGRVGRRRPFVSRVRSSKVRTLDFFCWGSNHGYFLFGLKFRTLQYGKRLFGHVGSCCSSEPDT